MFSTLKISAAAVLAMAVTTSSAVAAPGGDCVDNPFIGSDCVTIEKYDEIGKADLEYANVEVMTHVQATKAYPWYAKWFDFKWSDVELIRLKDDLYDIYKPTTTVSGDDVVDEDPPDADTDDDWEWLRVIIQILLAAAENADDIVYNSVYDGTIYSPSNNTSTAAVLQLRRLGNNVSAILWTDVGLVADTSWFLTCPDVDIPAGAFPFDATMVSGTMRAEGHVTKHLSIAGIGAGSVTADFSVEVLSDYEHLVADVQISTPTGCSDTAMTGTFTRRIGSEFQ